MGNKKPPQRYPHTERSIARELYRAGEHLKVAKRDFKDAERELANCERRMIAAKKLTTSQG